MNRVAVIGHFGGNNHFCDGQTIKTKNTAELLEKQNFFDVIYVDTYYFRTNKVRLLADTLRAMFSCEHIFLLVSVNGIRVYLPLLYFLNKFAKKPIYHYIIGSELLDMVAKNPKLVKYLNALTVNWFEYESGTRYLREKGVTNAETLVNFKMITPVEQAVPYRIENGTFRFCTFSRVMEEKGITDAIRTVRELNKKQGKCIALLDIYGPLEAAYEKSFYELLAENKDCVRYMGIADSRKSVEILKDYYALLFPTCWAGEGVPGTVIDAFAAGIPVIASDWNANREIIEDGKQGILYPNGDLETLEAAVCWAVGHPEEMDRMRMESRRAYRAYMPETVLNVILKEMEKQEVTQ